MKRKPNLLPPIQPNVGIQRAYQKRLDALIKEMGASVAHWLSARYKANPPEIARDASPSKDMIAEMRTLKRRWLKRFDVLSQEMATHFATSVADRTDAALKASLKKAGFAVEFKLTAAQNDLIQSAVGQNVTLIKLIPEQHLTQVEGIVLRGVQNGRDLATIVNGLTEQLGVTRSRAATIARSQTNMATAALERNRQMELGLGAKWKHSGGGKHPRPDHVAFAAGKNGGPFYDPKVGALIDGKRIWPGTEINCRCRSQIVLPSFDK